MLWLLRRVDMMTSVKFTAQCVAHNTRSLSIRCYFYLGDRSQGECPGGESKKGNRQRWYKGSHLWTRNEHSHCRLALVTGVVSWEACERVTGMGRGAMILFLTLDVEISHPEYGRKNIIPIKPLPTVQDFTLDESLKDDSLKKKKKGWPSLTNI